MVVFSLIVRRNGGFFRGFVVEMVVVSLIVRRNGVFFIDYSQKWFVFH